MCDDDIYGVAGIRRQGFRISAHLPDGGGAVVPAQDGPGVALGRGDAPVGQQTLQAARTAAAGEGHAVVTTPGADGERAVLQGQRAGGGGAGDGDMPRAEGVAALPHYPELENYLSPFMDAWKSGAQDQLQGQIASAKIPLTRMISPQLYWVMTCNDFSLDMNNPNEPKLLCVGNNPDRQNIYSAALGLYNSRIVKLINKKGQLKSTVIIDELPTIYFRGLDNLIATARSNKVAVCLGFQDFSQLNRDYGEKESKVVQNTVGNIFSGQVVGETARTLSERFGKVLQKRQSVSINRQDVSTSINTQLDSLIPASKIANLSQGTFVGAVSDNFGEKIEQKIFHAEIIVDHEKVSGEEKNYKKIPVINEFRDREGNDIMTQQIGRNYDRIKADAQAIINMEMERIKNDPELCRRLGLENEDDKKKRNGKQE